jgi:two-component system, NarL family, sensor histidine kinase DesK
MTAGIQPDSTRSVRIDQAGPVSLPRMWVVFVSACMVFAAFIGIWMSLDFPTRWMGVLGLVKIAALSACFLWATLRNPLTKGELSREGLSRTTYRNRLFAILAMLTITIALIPILPEFQAWWLLVYPMVAAGLTLPPMSAKLVIAGLTATSFACAWFLDTEFQPVLLTQAVVALAAVIIRIMTVRNIELEMTREDLARLAVAEERLRFSRDLHDSMGHTLSTITLKSELSSRLVEQDPVRAGQEMQDVERIARAALHDVRSVVTSYRQPTLEAEISEAREMLSSANVRCETELDKSPIPPAIESVLAWGVREGVTNIIRHSDARHCTIRILKENGTVRLELSDDGGDIAADRPVEYAGSGLKGLAERVAGIGGRLTAGFRHGGGFHLVLETPVVADDVGPS